MREPKRVPILFICICYRNVCQQCTAKDISAPFKTNFKYYQSINRLSHVDVKGSSSRFSLFATVWSGKAHNFFALTRMTADSTMLRQGCPLRVFRTKITSLPIGAVQRTPHSRAAIKFEHCLQSKMIRRKNRNTCTCAACITRKLQGVYG